VVNAERKCSTMSDYVCPECWHDYVHLQQPVVEGVIECGGADYKIIIPFYCENGCVGAIVYHHHEGQVKLTHTVSEVDDD